MGGKTWSLKEETFFWEMLAPQAPAGLDDLSKMAKKDARTAWNPLSEQMTKEMERHLGRNETLRREYTPLSCYEHYFQNYKHLHYSPHAKVLVEKYKADLQMKAAAGASRDRKGRAPQTTFGHKSALSQELNAARAQKMTHNRPPSTSKAMPDALMCLSPTPLLDETIHPQGSSPAMRRSMAGIRRKAGVSRHTDKSAIGLGSRVTRMQAVPCKDPVLSGPTTEGSAQREKQSSQRDVRRRHKLAERQSQIAAEVQSSSPFTASASASIAEPQVAPQHGTMSLPQDVDTAKSDAHNVLMVHRHDDAYYGSPYDYEPTCDSRQNARLTALPQYH